MLGGVDMVNVEMYINRSPSEKIGKDLQTGRSYTCLLKDGCSVLKPILILQDVNNDIYTFNYIYISTFNRYYFIDDIVSLNNNRWQISAHVDVLETYKTAILSQSAVIRRQQKNYNLYLNDPDFITYNNDSIQTLKFSGSDFNKTLSYVLVVNGS